MEQVGRFAVHSCGVSCTVVRNRANEVREAAQNVGQERTKNHGRDSSTDETFPGLLGAQLDERCFAKEESKHVRHDVIRDDHRDGYDEPRELGV